MSNFVEIIKLSKYMFVQKYYRLQMDIVDLHAVNAEIFKTSLFMSGKLICQFLTYSSNTQIVLNSVTENKILLNLQKKPFRSEHLAQRSLNLTLVFICHGFLSQGNLIKNNMSIL